MGEDLEWNFTEDECGQTATVEKVATAETFRLRKCFAQRYQDPGLIQRMSAGERGCAHSHWRLWNIAAGRESPTLVFEDDVQLIFDRSNDLGKSDGRVFVERLVLALEEAPADFDLLYLGWSGWRGGNNKYWQEPDDGKVIRRAEYVWTTVAYVISQAGAKKLLSVGAINQPVDNFMAWEASQGRLKSFVVLDEGDNNECWAGGIVDQFDFAGDSDVQKSDGGIQGDDASSFAMGSAEAGA